MIEFPGIRGRATRERGMRRSVLACLVAGALVLRVAAPAQAASPGPFGDPSARPGALSVMILGSGAPRFDPTRSRPSVFVRYGRANLLVDMGLGTERRLHEEGVDLGQLSAFLFTHHHIDHDAELAALLVESRVRGGAAKIVGPPGTSRYTRFLLDFYAEDIAYRAGRTGQSPARLNEVDVRDIDGGETLSLDGLAVRTARVPHSIHTVAYRFDSAAGSIVVSGDLTFSEDLIALAKGADILVVDSGGLPSGGDRATAQQRTGVGNLVLTHVGVADVDMDAVRARVGRIFSGAFELAADGMTLTAQRGGPRGQDTAAAAGGTPAATWTLNDTGQTACYDVVRAIACPRPGETFFGQDAQYAGKAPSYRDNGDDTVTDLNTGLMWSKAVERNKVSLVEAERIAREMRLGGQTDWRVPDIKELYSLIDFRGYTGFGRGGVSDEAPDNAIPFINTDYFDFAYGNTGAGERYIDAQWLSGTKYVSKTMEGDETLFGVNFADGRIKGYGYRRPGSRTEKRFYVRYVRGQRLGTNDFVDNGDGTVMDRSTGLMWMRADGGKPVTWEEALVYAESLVHAGYDDWRLPNAKELQYLVDYSRSPDTTGSPAIDPVFRTTAIINEAGVKDYPYFWTSTTHLDGPKAGSHAAYIAFGRAIGKMRGRVMDVHGAGAQRSDPKTGSPSIGSRAPQGDAFRARNYARAVRGGESSPRTGAPGEDRSHYPYRVNVVQHDGGTGVGRSPPSGTPR